MQEAEAPLPRSESTSDSQIIYKLPLAPSAEKRDTSGKSRVPSFGTPGPVCQGARVLGYTALGPPPPPERSKVASIEGHFVSDPEAAQESFHVCSGIYDLTEAWVVVLFVMGFAFAEKMGELNY